MNWLQKEVMRFKRITILWLAPVFYDITKLLDLVKTWSKQLHFQIPASLVGVHLVPLPLAIVPRSISHQAEQHPTASTVHVWDNSFRLRTFIVLHPVLLWGCLEILDDGWGWRWQQWSWYWAVAGGCKLKWDIYYLGLVWVAWWQRFVIPTAYYLSGFGFWTWHLSLKLSKIIIFRPTGECILDTWQSDMIWN